MWQVEVLVRQRVESALREGEQARRGKAVRKNGRKRPRTIWQDSVRLGVWLRSLFGVGGEEPGPSSVTAKGVRW